MIFCESDISMKMIKRFCLVIMLLYVTIYVHYVELKRALVNLYPL